MARLREGAERLARYCAIALGFTLPISVAADSVLMVLLLVSWLASARWRDGAGLIRANPVAMAALALFAVMALGLLWSQAPAGDAATYFKKYDDLLLVPILVTLILDPADRRRALFGLAAGVGLTVVLSYGLALGLVPTGGFITGTPDNPMVFKKHISQNIVVAFGSLLFAVLALNAPSHLWRAICWLAAILSAANVLFMVQGRTGYVILPVLAALVLFSALRWRGLALALLGVAATLGVAYQVSPAFKHRVDLVMDVSQRWQPGARAEEGVAERLEFWHNTLAIVRAHPWLGVGTGDFERAYAEQVAGTGMKVTRNPHNQYLLTTAQTGLLGLTALLALFAIQLRMAGRLPAPADALLARGLVLTIMIGSLFNSLLIDHTESLLFSWGAGLLFAGLAAPRSGAAP